MKYRLICVDLDGTLLTDDKKVNQKDIEALQKMEARGIRTALITGRMTAATEPIVRQLGIPCILACNAGTYILEEQQCIHTEYLSVEAMREINKEIRPFGIPLWIFRNKRWFVTAKDSFVETEERLIQYTPELVSVEELARQWEKEGTGPNKLLIVTEPTLIWPVLPRIFWKYFQKG